MPLPLAVGRTRLIHLEPRVHENPGPSKRARLLLRRAQRRCIVTYWKATRLNGTDFHTGTVDWDGNFYAFCPECFETLDGAE